MILTRIAIIIRDLGARPSRPGKVRVNNPGKILIKSYIDPYSGRYWATYGGQTMGRPRKNLPAKALDVIRQAASNGVKEVDIAKALGVDFRTWRRISDEDPEAREVYREAKSIEEGKLVGVLFDKAVNKQDSVAAIFLLKARHGYRDQGPTDGGDDGRPTININIPAPLRPRTTPGSIEVAPTALPQPGEEAA